MLIDHVYGGQPAPPTDPGCPHTNRGDVNCDGFVAIARDHEGRWKIAPEGQRPQDLHAVSTRHLVIDHQDLIGTRSVHGEPGIAITGMICFS